MAKYRQSKVKRQHHVLRELEPQLRFLSSLPSVDGVIPGTIRPKSGSQMGLTFQYFTPSGLKLIGRSSGAAQEIFVISQQPDKVLISLQEEGFLNRKE
ncbi:MAG: DUF2103 domain-containing protein [Firmicutes bacterium]|jgi:hypothetical protein|nr:DUF2103 domain-containing protein [Bacillota bacterium]MCL5015470.1 DUF2103 domain-containing protein [Bacillota bacterium]HBQ94550.1 hypothetical protein [Sulfobacillus sp.]